MNQSKSLLLDAGGERRFTSVSRAIRACGIGDLANADAVEALLGKKPSQ
jgi:hypothetical protein